MNNFSKNCAVLRTFRWLSGNDILGNCSDIDLKTLLSAMKGECNSINLTALDLVSKKYQVSKDFLIDGKMVASDLRGIIDVVDGGIVAYLPEAIAMTVVHWLVHNKPQHDVGEDWGGAWEDAGWEYYYDSLETNLLDVPSNKYPKEKIMIGDVCVGLCCDSSYKKKYENLINEAFSDLASKSLLSHQKRLTTLNLI